MHQLAQDTEHTPNQDKLLARDIATIIRGRVSLPKYAPEVLACWILHTWVFEQFDVTPRLVLQSPEKRCGKTITLGILEQLVNNPCFTGNVTAAYLFRKINSDRVTTLIDEFDVIQKERAELRNIINNGHRRGGKICKVIRNEAVEFEVFAPLAIALIGTVKDTIEDRSIVIPMRRKAKEEQLVKVSRNALNSVCLPIRNRIEKWARQFKAAKVQDLAILNDRANDNWTCILAIANDFGLLDVLTKAAESFSVEYEMSIGVRFLQDIKHYLEGTKDVFIRSEDLINHLICLPESNWIFGSRPITAKAISVILRPFGVSPTQARASISERSIRGYHKKDLMELVQRYCQ